MKQRILLIIAAMLCCAMTMFAQNNDRISYQAVVRDAHNNLVVNQELTVQVTVNDGQNTYMETHTVTSNANGLISLLIGGGTSASNNWDNINWKTATVSTTMSVGGVQIAAHSMPLTTVPSAMYADYADSVNPDVIARQIHDTVDMVRQEVGDVSEEVESLTNRMSADSANLKDNYTTTADLEDNYYNKDKINDTVDYILTQMANTSGNLNDNYYTRAQVDAKDNALSSRIEADSANLKDNYTTTADLEDNYYNKDKINDTITNILGQITTTAGTLLNNYYTKEQVDTAKAHIRYEVDTAKANIRAAMALKDAQLQNNIDNMSSHADATYATKTDVNAADNALSSRIEADSTKLVDFKGKVKQDSATLANRIYTDSTYLKGLIDNNTNNINNLSSQAAATYATKTDVNAADNALSARIEADSTKLVDFKNKGRTDSTTLRNLINTNANNISSLSSHADATYATKTDVNAADNALSSRIVADSTKLVDFKGKVKQDSATLANRIYTDSTYLKGLIDANTSSINTLNTNVSNTYATKLKVKADSNVVFDTLHTYYATKAKVKADSAILRDLINTNTNSINTLNTTVATKANAADVYNKSEMDTKLGAKADTTAMNTKLATKANSTDVNAALAAKANAADVYDKSTMDTKLGAKADTTAMNTKLSAKANSTDVNAALAAKANAADVYDKSEMDTKLGAKADTTAMNTKLATKANAADVYTKTATDNLLSDKANAADVYDKSTMDTKLGAKADTTAMNTKLSAKADADNVYDKNEVDNMISTVNGGVNHLRDSVKANISDISALQNAGYITKNVNDLTYYTTTADLQTNYATKNDLNAYATKATLHDDSLLLAQRLDALEAVREYSNKYNATADQTSFTLSQAPVSTHLVRIYINGVMVGDNDDSNNSFPAVISVSGTTVTYNPTNNGGYALRAGDRVVIYYFK